MGGAFCGTPALLPSVELRGNVATLMSTGRSLGMPVVEWCLRDAPGTAAAIGAACQRTGYFTLRNHGVSAELLALTFEETRTFYALSDEQKGKFNCSASSQFLGYRGLGAEKSLMHGGGEACEQYRIGNIFDTRESHGLVDYYNQPFRRATLLFGDMARLGDRLMSLCATGLGVDSTFFDAFMTSPMHRLGLNSYRVGAGRTIGNTVDIAMTAHIDHAVFTIVAQDEPGLEVLSPDSEWLDVPIDQDALFVFMGDYAQRWTNGHYRATTHRVREVARDRMSVQYKHRPSYATVVAALSPFVDEDRPSRYEPFNTGRQYEGLLQHLLG